MMEVGLIVKPYWIFRDSNGSLQGAGQITHGNLTVLRISTTSTGFLLCKLQCALIKGYKNVIFEGDSKQLHDLVTHKKHNIRLNNWIKETSISE